MSKSSAGLRSILITAFRSMKNRLNVFYILAFVPLPLIAYYDIRYLSPLIFGFLFLLLKRQRLSACNQALHGQKALGIIIILSSFIVYYALFSLFPLTLFYGEGAAANYIAYIFGLFLTFFDLSALRNASTPIFVIIATTSISFISIWLKLSLSPYIIPRFVSLIGTILNALGVKATTHYPNIIMLHTWRGTIPFQIIWGCIGTYSTLVFSMLMIIVFSEEPGSLKTKMLWAVVGVIGVLVLNVIRVVIILVLARNYTAVATELFFHPFLGYALFFPWLALFLYTFSKRHVILEKILSVRQKLR